MEYTRAEPQQEVETKRKGAPRWMWTFADLMSLLFALFVLLLTFAEFDPQRFSSTADSVRATFDADQGRRIVRSIAPGILPFNDGDTIQETTLDDEELRKAEELKQRKEDTLHDLRRSLGGEIDRNVVQLEETEQGILLRFPSASAFPSGGSDLKGEILPAIAETVEVLARTPGHIEVSGHTDDVPISTAQYRSNWDLSTARAVSVVHEMLELGLEQGRLSATGFAESRPLNANDTPGNRANNRRVEIELILGTEE
ncbi:OmpA family protein [Magnetospira sp. QH-2]|uniref:OmpA family protein n=1 Tax=Magnetospira sp. (strain QH-2) TaxID=1288970 RepID=UPI0003E81800|nr:OmpA family protein [Magnetospira sp. QH-2]CCQ73599.1 putative Chemotaxis protein motB [Magnetospira sp. QH-2]